MDGPTAERLQRELDAYCARPLCGHRGGRAALGDLLRECPALVELLEAVGVETGQVLAKRNRRWTKEDERDLAEMFASGWTDEEMARELERPVQGTRSRRLALGLRRDRAPERGSAWGA